MSELNPHDAALLRNVRRRVNRARNFPENTCSASRHLHLIAAELARLKPPNVELSGRCPCRS